MNKFFFIVACVMCAGIGGMAGEMLRSKPAKTIATEANCDEYIDFANRQSVIINFMVDLIWDGSVAELEKVRGTKKPEKLPPLTIKGTITPSAALSY